MDVLIAYDIADTDGAGASRLRRIAGICEKYGERVQLSVFECRLSPTRFARMIGEVRDTIDSQKDSVSVYRFAGCIGEWRMHIGKPPEREVGQLWIA